MNIPALGELRPHEDVPEWLASEPIAVSYFDGLPLSFILEGVTEEDESDVTAAVDAFLALGPADRLAASPFVFKNYQHMAEMVDDEDLGCSIDTAEDVWQYVEPSEIYVRRRHRRDKAIYVHIAAECEWEPEHGLQIVYRRGVELSRVSDQDGHLTHTDAYDVPEDEDKIA